MVSSLGREVHAAKRLADLYSLNIGREVGRSLDIAQNFSPDPNDQNPSSLNFDQAIQVGLGRVSKRGLDLAQSYAAFDAVMPSNSVEMAPLRRICKTLLARDESELVVHNDEQEALGFLRWYCRASLLKIISSFDPPIGIGYLRVKKKSGRIEGIQKSYDRAVDFFATLAIIEERRIGTVEAQEGILIVKERRGT